MKKKPLKMNEYELTFEDDLEVQIFEMANLRTENTGLKNCIYISSKQHSSGPRLKVFKQGNCKGPSISVYIDSRTFRYKDSSNIIRTIDAYTLERVQALISAYEDVLLLFWYDTDCIVDIDFKRKLAEFIKNDTFSPIEIGSECVDKMKKIQQELEKRS